MAVSPSWATIVNKNGYVFGKTQKYCFAYLAEEAAKKMAKRKKIDLKNKEIFKIVLHS